MKRLALIFTCLLLLSACSSPQQSDENVNPFFNAEVVRWDADEVLLSPVVPDEEIDDQFALLEEFTIPASTFEEHGITALESGDMIRVVCSGLQKMTIPILYLLTLFFPFIYWTQTAISLMNKGLGKQTGLLKR